MLCFVVNSEPDAEAEGTQSRTRLTLSIITMIALGAIIISLVIIAGLMFYYFHDYHKTNNSTSLMASSHKRKRRKSSRAKLAGKSIKQILAKQQR